MRIDKMKYMIVAFLLLVSGVLSMRVDAHCDGLDGPVVKAARAALDSGNPNLVLIWVQERYESEAGEAFRRTLAVRKLGPEARELADRYFYETAVRLHRAGEGEAFSGLKPQGQTPKLIAAADRALETGSAGTLLGTVPQPARAETGERFSRLLGLSHYNQNDLASGRRFVREYVEFMHYIESLEGHEH